MPNTAPHFKASGTIRPARFVKISGSNTCAESDANEKVIGVSMLGTNQPPLEDLVTNAYAAESGDSLEIHGDGDICYLELGSGGATAGQDLKSDADGKGVAAATTGTTIQQIGATALETASAGELCRVQVYRATILPAVA